MLLRYIRACCPQQAIDEFTPDAWHHLIGHLDANTAHQAVMAVLRRQPFVSPAEILHETRHRPYERPYADVAAAANRRQLGTGHVQPNAAYLAAKAGMDEKLARRAAEMEAPELPPLAVSERVRRLAAGWLARKLTGRLPPEPDHTAPPSPRWAELPDDPPELREWLAMQEATEGSTS